MPASMMSHLRCLNTITIIKLFDIASSLKLVSHSARALYPLQTDAMSLLTAYGHCNPVPFSWQRMQRFQFMLLVILIRSSVVVSVYVTLSLYTIKKKKT